MKKLLLIFAICNWFSNLVAQEIIITKNADTIRCSEIERGVTLIEYLVKGVKYKTSYDSLSYIIKKKYNYSIVIEDWYWINGIKYSLPFGNIQCSFSQPTYKLTKNVTDEFTGNIKRYTNYNAIGGPNPNPSGTKIVVWMDKIIDSTKTFYYIELRSPSELGCSGSLDNYVMIKLKNNDIIKLEKDIADIDCDKNAVSKYYITDEIAKKLRNNEVKSIRFKQSKFYQDFNIIFPDYFIKTLELLDSK